MDKTKVKNMFVGKTVQSVDIINAEYGRSYTFYLCFVFTDGTRGILVGDIPINPNPDVKDMSGTDYFTPEDIANTTLRLEQEKRERIRRAKEQDKLEFERLKKRLGITE